ncbi:hypothetical protein SYNPS1DRAFT_31016 [Syncephalis pseudoplumigaleata]|uniref:Uncharacterized protein n=1 Tax=Syncephalis pseudoplumigaleata TaxID=1712513 RepID=A0A4P9YTX4_9FUNG|nr:hypothetical protein SYNPS1DRAFT_31016 [Syncephalis pseudoplumigaleata]|eukprot:RKP23264.1 hypothetical protein SYNPS1DRAFT_31016 [Syncephalis pseudoplumigaleata]
MLIKSISRLAIATLCALLPVVLWAVGAVVEASDFASLELFQSASERCRQAVEQLDKSHSMLATCYPEQSLYFQIIPRICTPHCLDVTVQAARNLVDACDLHINSPSSQLPYYVWSNRAAATASCQKVDEKTHCAQELLRVASNWMLRGMPSNAGKAPAEHLDCDNPCMRQIYWSVNGDERFLALVYFNMLPDAAELFNAFKEHCPFAKHKGVPRSDASPDVD